MLRSKWFPGFPRTPFTPGVDLVGVVDLSGADASAFDGGQRVACMLDADCGGYAEYVCVPEERLVAVPHGVDSAEAVCVLANYVTADAMMRGPAQVKPGERVLVHGAAGGVGSALLELGALEGLVMFGTASSGNLDVVTALGATPIDYRTDDFVERIRSMTGDGVDVVFDQIGGARQLWHSYRSLRPGGRLVWFGVAATARSGIGVIPSSLVANRLLALLPDGRKAPLSPTPDARTQRTTIVRMLDLLADGEIHPLVAKRVPLADAEHAHRLLEAGGVAGKIVLTTSTG
jgi:NADPH:quinone reductase-like Zn-dependent oxidoreductase